MQLNLNLVRTVRETVGDGVDVMADAYMGWTLDYAKRMLPFLEPFNLRWLEEPVIPDDVHGYADGEPTAKDGFIDLGESVPGLGLTINEAALEKFGVTE